MTNPVAWGLHRRKWTWTLLFVLLMTTLTVGPTQAISRLIDSSSKLVDKIATALARFENAIRVEDSFAGGGQAPQGPAAVSDVGSNALSAASDDSESDADQATSTGAAAVTGSTDSQGQSPSTSAAPSGGLNARRGTFAFDPRYRNISGELGLPSLSLDLFPTLGLPDEADIPTLPLAYSSPASGAAGVSVAAGAALAGTASGASSAVVGTTGAPSPTVTSRADDVQLPAPTFVASLKDGLDLDTQLELSQQSALFTPLASSEEAQLSVAATGGVSAVATPEPSTLALLSLGVAGVARLRRRRSRP